MSRYRIRFNSFPSLYLGTAGQRRDGICRSPRLRVFIAIQRGIQRGGVYWYLIPIFSLGWVVVTPYIISHLDMHNAMTSDNICSLVFPREGFSGLTNRHIVPFAIKRWKCWGSRDWHSFSMVFAARALRIWTSGLAEGKQMRMIW